MPAFFSNWVSENIISISFVFFLIADVAAFILYGLDKYFARRHFWRISVFTLLVSSFFGGVGAFIGMYVFRHKTKKLYFTVPVGIMMGMQVFLLTFLYYKFGK